jgi:glycerol-3-phosphate dehydrogenase (NAD+)
MSVGFALKSHAPRLKVAFIGAGNAGTAFARRAALNILDKDSAGADHPFEKNVTMWIHDEEVEGRKLSEIMNVDGQNPKYLPGVSLPRNLVANADLAESCDADILLFVVPHQFLPATLEKMRGLVKPNAIAVSLIKGLDIGPDGPKLLSQMIHRELGLVTDVAVLMGANIATDVANDEYNESTAACRNPDISQLIAELFHCHCMQIDACTDVGTVEICGALKNVIAMGGGICDALGLGQSSKGAVLRRGIKEMSDFCKLFVGEESFNHESLLESCALADVIATSYGGRNRKCSHEFAKRILAEEAKSEQVFVSPGNKQPVLIYDHTPHYIPIPDAYKQDSKFSSNIVSPEQVGEQLQRAAMHTAARTTSVEGPAREAYLRNMWNELERDVLAGQKLQGLGTLDEVMICLNKLNLIEESNGGDYPQKFGFFKRMHAIARLGESPRTLFDWT